MRINYDPATYTLTGKVDGQTFTVQGGDSDNFNSLCLNLLRKLEYHGLTPLEHLTEVKQLVKLHDKYACHCGRPVYVDRDTCHDCSIAGCNADDINAEPCPHIHFDRSM